MTRDARLERLPCRLPVAEAEAGIRIVVPDPAESRRCDEPGLFVTALAELRRVMTVAAVRLTRVRGARVPSEKLSRMVRVLAGRVRPMAVEARRAYVTGLARARTRIRLGPMMLSELGRVARRHGPDDLRTGTAPGTSGRHRVHDA